MVSGISEQVHLRRSFESRLRFHPTPQTEVKAGNAFYYFRFHASKLMKSADTKLYEYSGGTAWIAYCDTRTMIWPGRFRKSKIRIW